MKELQGHTAFIHYRAKPEALIELAKTAYKVGDRAVATDAFSGAVDFLLVQDFKEWNRNEVITDNGVREQRGSWPAWLLLKIAMEQGEMRDSEASESNFALALHY